MKRLIQRQQVIDCGSETCGACRQLVGTMCVFWGKRLLIDIAGRKERLYQCRNAEFHAPALERRAKERGK